MTKLEINDAKTLALDANDAIFEAVEVEKRSMTNDEINTVERNLQRIKELDLKLESENRKDGSKGAVSVQKRSVMTSEPKEHFSLIKVINNRINNMPLDGVARDMSLLAEQQFRNAGISTVGDIHIPMEIRADILAGTATQGQEIVSEDKKAILPPLLPKLVFSQAGVTFLTGLKGNVSVPSYSGTTVAWKGEVASADDGAGVFSEVTLSPKRLTAMIDVSKLFLAQDTVGAERLLLDNIATAVALKLESTILGSVAITATQPDGMGADITYGTPKAAIIPTYAKMLAMETSVNTTNALQGNLAYITNGAGRGILKGIQTVSGVSSKFLLEDGMMNGYPVLVSNSVTASAGAGASANLIVFGNWADLVIGQWGGYDITVDPYTVAPEGQVRIVINAYFDAKGLRGTASGTSGFDYYAKSFSKEAIKAS